MFQVTTLYCTQSKILVRETIEPACCYVYNGEWLVQQRPEEVIHAYGEGPWCQDSEIPFEDINICDITFALSATSAFCLGLVSVISVLPCIHHLKNISISDGTTSFSTSVNEPANTQRLDFRTVSLMTVAALYNCARFFCHVCIAGLYVTQDCISSTLQLYSLWFIEALRSGELNAIIRQLYFNKSFQLLSGHNARLNNSI